jgi:hypothetical protein
MIRTKTALVFLFTVLFAACVRDGSNSLDKVLPTSSGKYGEVLVVIDSVYEQKKSGEAIDQIFYKSVEGLPQQEAMFRMSTVDPDDFRSILKRSRNILRLTISSNRKARIKVEEDVWAKNQLLIQVEAPNDEEASRLLLKNKENIQDYFNEREKERLQKQFSIKPDKEIEKRILKRFEASILIPPGFVVMDTSGNGLWLKKEKQIGQHQVMQGIMIYEVPYTSDSTFSLNEMVLSRDFFTQSHVQGMRDSSYMAVYREYKSSPREVNLNGKYAVEYRGLWNMKNDFMGGPFVHYTIVDEKRNRVLHIDGFVYAPKFNKREYVRELDAILQTFEILPTEKSSH